MKLLSLFFVLLIACPKLASAGEFSSNVLKRTDGLWSYEKVVSVPGASQGELYKRVKQWVLGTVKTGDVNTIYDDKTEALIITTPTIALPNQKYDNISGQVISFKLQVDFKEGRLRVSASGFNYFGVSKYHNREIHNAPLETLSLKQYIPDPYRQIQESFDKSFAAFMDNLENAAQKPVKNDW